MTAVTIVGTGYVGLVTGVCLAKIGHSVMCIDIQADRIEQINRGEPPIYEPGLRELLQEQLHNGRFQASTELAAAVARSEVTMIAVGTPFDGERIDLRYVIRAANEIGTALKDSPNYHLVVVKSTVVPTTTDTVVAKALSEASGKTIGDQLGLAMNPEFLQEGSAVENFLDPDRIVIGAWDARSAAAAAQLYTPFQCPIVTTTLRNAELIKYASNALLATMISFSNELATLCETLPGLDVETIMDGLHLDRRLTPRHEGREIRPGILSYLRAGSGFGGSCLPKDVKALRAFSTSHGLPSPMLSAVLTVNEDRARDLVGRARNLIGDLTNRKIAVLGLAFKAGTDDTRDSPALRLIDELLRSGAAVHVFDPIAKIPEALGDKVTVSSSTPEAVDGASAAFIATAWPEFVSADWSELVARMANPIVVDGRNALRQVTWPAGVQYLAVGRS